MQRGNLNVLDFGSVFSDKRFSNTAGTRSDRPPSGRTPEGDVSPEAEDLASAGVQRITANPVYPDCLMNFYKSL
jgi:hypothetical protein